MCQFLPFLFHFNNCTSLNILCFLCSQDASTAPRIRDLSTPSEYSSYHTLNSHFCILSGLVKCTNILCFQDLVMQQEVMRGMAIAPGKEAGQGTASVVAGWLLLVGLQPLFLVNQ